MFFLRLYSICVFFIDLLNFSISAFFETISFFIHIFIPSRKKSIKNEIILIVGASRGIGRALAQLTAKLGATVVCLDINIKDNKSLVEEIRNFGGIAYEYTCDVTSQENVSNTIANIKKELNTNITMMFHCCGIPSIRKYSTQPPPLRSTMDLSILSHFWLLDEVLPEMKQNKHGHIIFLTSVAGISGIERQIPLYVAQFAVKGLFESLLDELAKEKLNKNVLVTLAHIYPFVVNKKDNHHGFWSNIPNWFGQIDTEEAAKLVLEDVLKNHIEISIPKYVLWLSHIVKLLPRRIILIFREFLDTGVDLG
ncbi:17-beta-hydroxysteroid dehydrogenase 13-like [Condylostylus longicornis]|uniref:17-beta-hydroxysteroid dehydrogenase 13-like n=1 Tax=Condylostylus longicornis TaxID=2530218 RepID=UPI00244E50C1|nr:17-beta-hydroxysteroid dehydrogenase 13-like [Condylostylus longicornis]